MSDLSQVEVYSDSSNIYKNVFCNPAFELGCGWRALLVIAAALLLLVVLGLTLAIALLF